MSNHKQKSFLLDKKQICIVKPSKPTPTEILSLSTIDNDPFLEAFVKIIYIYKAADSISNPTTKKDPVVVIKEALSKTLVYFYPLAGKLKRETSDRKLRLNCNGDGVLFTESAANSDLSSLSYLDHIDNESANMLFPDYDPSHESGNALGYHPLVLQLTKFPCGGFTIGMGLAHSVCDGYGIAHFFRTLAELASGELEPTVKPVWERERLVIQPTNDRLPPTTDMTLVATSPYTSSSLISEIINVSPNAIKKLKRSTLYNNVDTKEPQFTTFEVLAAYVWQSRCRALKLSHDGLTMIGLAIGIKHRFEPALPKGYYGNAFVATNVVLKAKELDESPFVDIVKLIRSSKNVALEEGYVKQSMENLENALKHNVGFESGKGAFMLTTDWRQLGLLEEVDFGWKATVNIIPLAPHGIPDVCIFLPPSKLDPSMEGGVRVHVTLPKEAMDAFKKQIQVIHENVDDNIV